MRVLIIDMSEHVLSFDEFVKPIERAIEGIEFFSKHHSEVTPADLQLADKVILSGTPLRDFAYLDGNFSWLKEFNKPVLGICAGMQVLALEFGGELKTFKQIGMANIKTLEKNKLFTGEFQAYALHTKAIKPIKDFIVLAESKNCIEAIKHKEKPFYGMLFHPEVRNQEIIENFVKKQL